MSLKFLVPAATAAFAATAFAAPTVSDVTMQQNGHRVDITYKLDADAIVTLDVQTNGVSIGYDKIVHLAGDVNVPVKAGTRSIVWTPYKDWPDGGTLASAKAVVTAWAYDAPPPYCAVSLIAGTDNVRFYSDEKAIPGGVQDNRYKTDWLLLRKIPAAGVTWMMGNSVDFNTDTKLPSYPSETPHLVTFSADYYIGVYEYTCAQWRCYHSTWMNGGTVPPRGDPDELKPAYNISWNNVRGNAAEGSNWPKETAVGGTVAWLRTHCPAFTFDLPTEAQWEFAARAGSSALYADGTNAYSADSPYYYDNGTTKYPKARCAVGTTTLPNAWGLYDMCGSVMEHCLDGWRESITAAETDPMPECDASAERICRGGSYGDTTDWGSQPYARYIRLPHRGHMRSSAGGPDRGFRICAPAVYTPAP